MHKGLPLPGRFLEARLRKLAAEAEPPEPSTRLS